MSLPRLLLEWPHDMAVGFSQRKQGRSCKVFLGLASEISVISVIPWWHTDQPYSRNVRIAGTPSWRLAATVIISAWSPSIWDSFLDFFSSMNVTFIKSTVQLFCRLYLSIWTYLMFYNDYFELTPLGQGE